MKLTIKMNDNERAKSLANGFPGSNVSGSTVIIDTELPVETIVIIAFGQGTLHAIKHLNK